MVCWLESQLAKDQLPQVEAAWQQLPAASDSEEEGRVGTSQVTNTIIKTHQKHCSNMKEHYIVHKDINTGIVSV